MLVVFFGLEENVFRSFSRRPILLYEVGGSIGTEGTALVLRGGGCVVGRQYR